MGADYSRNLWRRSRMRAFRPSVTTVTRSPYMLRGVQTNLINEQQAYEGCRGPVRLSQYTFRCQASSALLPSIDPPIARGPCSPPWGRGAPGVDIIPGWIFGSRSDH